MIINPISNNRAVHTSRIGQDVWVAPLYSNQWKRAIISSDDSIPTFETPDGEKIDITFFLTFDGELVSSKTHKYKPLRMMLSDII